MELFSINIATLRCHKFIPSYPSALMTLPKLKHVWTAVEDLKFIKTGTQFGRRNLGLQIRLQYNPFKATLTSLKGRSDLACAGQ